MKVCIDKRWRTFTSNMVLSAVVGLPILSVCPDSGDEFVAMLSNSILHPRVKACENSTISNLFSLYLQITRALVLVDQTILYLVIVHS